MSAMELRLQHLGDVEIVNTDDTLPGGLGHSSSSTTRRRSLKLAETVGNCWDLLGKQWLVGGLGW